MNWKSFSMMEKENQEYVGTKKMYISITGDLVTAILFSRILYWFLPGKTGQSKIRILRDQKEWIAKKRTDWKNECSISPTQFDRSIKILVNLGFVETKVYKFAGEPTLHISLDKNKVIEEVSKFFDKKSKENEDIIDD